jgi:hypothetical protein
MHAARLRLLRRTAVGGRAGWQRKLEVEMGAFYRFPIAASS